MKLLLFISIFLFSNTLQAQKKRKIKDTVYYQKYNERLIVSVFQSYKNFGIDISQKLTKDSLGQSKATYIAESNYITGLEFNYDKLNISFGINSKPPANQAQKGSTSYKNFALNIGGNKWLIENSYRRYKGFYNTNTGSYDTSFKHTGIFTQNPSLTSELYKTKFLFFTNSNKFSFKSGYSCSYRQLKTAFSFVLSGNIFYNRLNSDSSFVPFQARYYYSDHQSINGLNVFAFSVYGGGSFNLVLWKAFFTNLTLIIGPEEQWRTYSYLDTYKTETRFYTSISGDFRASMGLNFKKFFTLISYTSDFSWYNSSQLEFKSKYYSVNFAIGLRLHVKTPKFYQRFQETKLYHKL